MRTISLFVLALAATLPAVEFHLDGYVGHVAGDQELAPLDKRTELGALVDARLPLMPFSVGANGFWSRKKDDGVTLTSRELQVGLVEIFDPLVLVHPFIGGGATLAHLDLEADGAGSHSGQALGGWAHVGVHVNLLLCDVGALAGWSRALVDTGAGKYDAGGLRAGVFIGIGF